MAGSKLFGIAVNGQHFVAEFAGLQVVMQINCSNWIQFDRNAFGNLGQVQGVSTATGTEFNQRAQTLKAFGPVGCQLLSGGLLQGLAGEEEASEAFHHSFLPNQGHFPSPCGNLGGVVFAQSLQGLVGRSFLGCQFVSYMQGGQWHTVIQSGRLLWVKNAGKSLGIEKLLVNSRKTICNQDTFILLWCILS
jgi:hypothetical protein